MTYFESKHYLQTWMFFFKDVEMPELSFPMKRNNDHKYCMVFL